MEAEKNTNIVMVKELRKFLKIGMLAIILVGMNVSGVTAQENATPNNVLIFKDPRIDYLLKVYAAKNKTKIEAKKVYRVQVIATTSRKEVNEAKSLFSSKFPGIPVFISFAPPTFRLRAGNFLERKDAQSFLREVRKSFPASFVVE